MRLVAFNLHEPKELYRQDEFTYKDLDQVTRLLDGLQLGMVDYQILQHPGQERELLRTLIHREVNESSRSNIVVFLGPDGSYGRDNPAAPVDLPAPEQRVFYLQFRRGGQLFAPHRHTARIVDVEPAPPIACQNMGAIACGSGTPAPPAPREPSYYPDIATPVDPDAIASVVRKLKGRVLIVRTVDDFAKAIERIGRP